MADGPQPLAVRQGSFQRTLEFAPRWRRHVWAGLSVCTLGLGGCGSMASGGLIDGALGMVGLQRPPVASDENMAAAKQLAKKPQKVTLRLHAGQVLNTDASGQSLSVVARIYKLRDKQAFENAPAAAFMDPKNGVSQELTADTLEAREVVLTPGQKYEVVETLPGEAAYIGVVALFRAPAEQRWHFVFDAKSAASSGITLGLHGCAISVASGQALDVPQEWTRLAGVQCTKSP
jgi:type VI secretion system protein VasD